MGKMERINQNLNLLEDNETLFCGTQKESPLIIWKRIVLPSSDSQDLLD